jgi:uncharacterized repeat protein (TIGR03803 family)
MAHFHLPTSSVTKQETSTAPRCRAALGPAYITGYPVVERYSNSRVPETVGKRPSFTKFTRGSDGATPFGAIVLDGAGNLYGTATAGGASGNGVVFQLSPTQGGSWIETVVHTFAEGTDGSFPASTLIFDKAGNLYGTTAFGGGSTVCGSNGAAPCTS